MSDERRLHDTLRDARWQTGYWRQRFAVIRRRGSVEYEILPVGRLDYIDRPLVFAMYRPHPRAGVAELYGGELKQRQRAA